MNKKQTRNPFLAALFLPLALFACRAVEPQAAAPASLVIASWNVQALFDGNQDGGEYAEYRNDAGWSEEKYRGRLNALVAALKSEQIQGPDKAPPGVLALVELENAGIAEEIAQALKYRWSFFAAAPGASLGTAFLSRFPIIAAKTHSINADGKPAPRPIAEIQLEAAGEPLIFFVCHWKSKLGGQALTEKTRRAEASVIARRLYELERSGTKAPVIIMGDLNENHDEFERTLGQTALLSDTGAAAAFPGAGEKRGARRPGFQDFLVLCGTRPPEAEYVTGAFESSVLYSPWKENREAEEQTGSFFYKDNWETIDHILFNAAAFGGTGWEFEGFTVVNRPPFANSRGEPAAYNPRTGNGLSDHLPVMAFLRRRSQEKKRPETKRL